MEHTVTEIWENFDRQLKVFVCNKMNNHDDCRDVLQEVYIKIIRNIDKINSIHNVSSYLTRLAQNTINDFYRQHNKTNLITTGDVENVVIIDETFNHEKTLNDCCFNCLEPSIDILPLMYKEALIMSELQGIPQKEVAEKLGISLSGAKSRVQRAREKLKDEVLKCCYNNDFY